MDNEELVCPFCGRSGFKRKCDLSLHIRYCKENPNRIEPKKVSPETRKKQSESRKKYFKDPKNREKQSIISKNVWDEETRKKQSEIKKKYFEDPKNREKMRVASKKYFENPENRIKASEIQKISNNRPKVKEKISKSLKLYFKNPENRKKLSNIFKGKPLAPETKEKITEGLLKFYSNEENANLKHQKTYNTKKKNNSFHTSKIEEQLKDYFNNNNIEYIHQYKSDKYPFSCDFYFPQKDLYVEIQGMWTHGDMPYIEDDKECIEQLELWKSKNTKFYDNAIDTWTVRDVKKRETAKVNNLNWIEIFSRDLNECLKIILNNL